jgi:hypothetical protein
MKGTIQQFNKLRGRSLEEIKTRGRQEFAKRYDRLFNRTTRRMSDKTLYAEFSGAARNGFGEGSAALLLERIRRKSNLFLPALGEREMITELSLRRFPVESKAIIATAEKAIRGRFDLLGFTDLDFGTPIDWALDPIAGSRAPSVHWSRIDPVAPFGGGDLKIVWEINRCAHFVAFGQAYWLTGDEAYAAAFVAQTEAWIEENPPGWGIGWAASLDVSFRAIAWLWAFHLCADSPKLTPEFVARFLKAMIDHGRHIEKYLSYYFSPNTHLTGEALGLFYLGAALPELRRAEGWRRLGLEILFKQLPIHVRSDGVYFEQSSYYHRYTTDFYLHLFALLRAGALPLSREHESLLWQKLEAMFNHLMWIERPNRTSPLFGDDDGGRLLKFAPRAGNDFRDTLAIGAAIFKRDDWKHAAGEAPAELVWVLGAGGVESYDNMESVPSKQLTRAFPVSGYFVMRDGWDRDSNFVLIDCGRHGSELGPGHAHADALSIEVALRGVSWIVDPATFVYGAHPATRDWFRSTEAHNTVCIDETGQSEPGAPFSWRTMAACTLEEFQELPGAVVFRGSHDGYRRLPVPVTHTRQVLMDKKASGAILFINDSFNGSGRRRYTLRYHLTPQCEATINSKRIEATTPEGEILIISVIGAGVNARIEQGWVSTCYGSRSSAPIAVFEISAEGPVELLSVIQSPPNHQS